MLPYTARQGHTPRRPTVPMLLVGCGVLLSVAVGGVGWLTVSTAPRGLASPGVAGEERGVPGAVLQRTYGLRVPAGVRGASYLVVPGDGSADSGQDLYLRFRTTPAGLEEFVRSLGDGSGDLAVGAADLDQDDLDSVGLPWRIGPGDHLAGLSADLPEQGDTVGTALLTVDETDAVAPLVYAHVTVWNRAVPVASRRRTAVSGRGRRTVRSPRSLSHCVVQSEPAG